MIFGKRKRLLKVKERVMVMEREAIMRLLSKIKRSYLSLSTLKKSAESLV